MRHILTVAAVVFMIPCAVSGNFVPIYEDIGGGELENAAVPFSFTPDANRSPLVNLFCEDPPSAEEIAGALTYRSSLLTASQAGSLGFPFFSANGSRNRLVLVRDYSRSAECLANDGETKLLYGQAIRTILTISDWEASANLSLAIVAADATLGNKSHKILVQVLGFADPGMSAAVSDLAGQDFDVTTYAKFLELESKLIKIAGNDPNPQVRKLGAAMDVSDSDIENAIAVSHAVYQISKGKSCNIAKVNAPNLNASRERAIEDTYQELSGGCNNEPPSRELRNRAKDLLGGATIPGA